METQEDQLKLKHEDRKERMRAYYQSNKARWRKYKEAIDSKLTEADREAIRERSREYHRAYYEANRDRIIARTSAYNRSNAAKHTEYRAAWYQANKGRIREQRRGHYHAVVKPKQKASKASSDFLTIREAVELLGAKLRTFREWVYRGQIESVRTPGGRFLLKRKYVEDLRNKVNHLPADIRKSLGLSTQEAVK